MACRKIQFNNYPHEQEGHIALDQPVMDFLPWLRLAVIETCRRIPVRMLLNHTSGLGPWDAPATWTRMRALRTPHAGTWRSSVTPRR